MISQNHRLFWTIILMTLAACSPKVNAQPEPDLIGQVRESVSATLTAIPSQDPAPSATPFPTATPFSLIGLFCEFQFCIGHPADVAFYDVSAQQNPLAPSSLGQGMLAAINNNLFLQVLWQSAPGAADPEFMLDLILEEVDTRSGTLEVRLSRGMNLVYTEITTTATPLLPFGAAASWICKDRAFAWKVYSPQAETTRAFFDEMFNKFRCEP